MCSRSSSAPSSVEIRAQAPALYTAATYVWISSRATKVATRRCVYEQYTSTRKCHGEGMICVQLAQIEESSTSSGSS